MTRWSWEKEGRVWCRKASFYRLQSGLPVDSDPVYRSFFSEWHVDISFLPA
jgi:hypothetical protein